MNYDEFAQAAAYYQKISNYDSRYWPYFNRVQKEWDQASIGFADCIIDFLNKWQMRLRKSPALLEGLFRTVGETQSYIKAFRNIRIEECDLRSTLKVGGELIRIQTGALLVFEMFYSVGHKFADVATAKTLHLLAPGFFVIWDSSTQYNLTSARGSYAWRYAFSFLPRVHSDLQELIQETQIRFNLTRQKTIQKLESLGRNRKTLAKLADEYYYSRFTRRLFDKKSR